MIVVVAIIALIVGLSFPSATAGLENVRIVSAGDSVAAFLNGAVNRAERHQEPVELVIAQAEGVLTLHSNEPGFARELKMPEGVSIESVLPAIVDPLWDTSRILDDSGRLGGLIASFTGYRARPALLPLIALVVYWSVVLIFLRRTGGTVATAVPPAVSSSSAVDTVPRAERN